MPTVKRIHFSADIAAPVSRVFRLMLEPASYEDWTSAFVEGSRYEGSGLQPATAAP